MTAYSVKEKGKRTVFFSSPREFKFFPVFSILLLMLSSGANTAALAESAPKNQAQYTLISCAELKEVHTILQGSLKKLLPSAQEIYLDYQSPQARQLIAELKIEFIPFVVFNEYVALEESFFEMVKRNMIEKKKARYTIPEVMLQAAQVRWLGREQVPNRLDVFVSSNCASCKKAEVKLINFIRENKLPVDLQIRYIANIEAQADIATLPDGAKESLRQIAIRKCYPEKFWDYLLAVNDQTAQQAAVSLGISLDEDPAQQQEALDILRQDYALAKSFKVRLTPTFLWENAYLIPSLEGLKQHEPFTALDK